MITSVRERGKRKRFIFLINTELSGLVKNVCADNNFVSRKIDKVQTYE